jgi:2-aminoadipate transaminase
VDINLGVGYVNERTIPAGKIHHALGEVLHEPRKYRQALNYGGPAGSETLIASIRQYILDNRIGELTEAALADREIIVGPNGATSLLESVACVLPRGIVITSDPMYYIYTNFLQRCGFEMLTVPQDDEGLRTDLLADKIHRLGDRTRELSFVYVVTVDNPTCAILSNRRRSELVEIVSELSRSIGRRVPIIFDKAYEDLVHDPNVEPLKSALPLDSDQIVYEVGTLSKVLAPGLRIGYMIGSPGRFLSAIVQRTSDSGFSAPMITQGIASRLLDTHITEQLENVRSGYRQKANAVGEWLSEYLGDQLEAISGGKAGFYFYLTFHEVETNEGSAFFRYLTRTTGDESIDGAPGDRNPRVIYIPGEYCVHPAGELGEVGRRQLRISYGFEELDAIHKAIRLMREAVEYARTKRGV